MPILYIMCGVGFSGKSTLAKNIANHFGIPLVSLDALFFEKQDELKLDLDSDEHWRMLFRMAEEKMVGLLKDGKSVVFDSINVERKHRDSLRELARKAGGRAVVVYLDTPENVLNERQERNKTSKERHDVKQEYLDDAKLKLEPPSSDEEVYVFSPNLDLGSFLSGLPK